MSLVQDFRIALRVMKSSKGFVLAATSVLALGIGANTAIFSVVHAVLLNPLPYNDPGRLVRLYERNVVGENPFNTVSPANYEDWQRDAKSFEQIAAYTERFLNLPGEGAALPERLRTALCSANLFPTLGVQPARGRMFNTKEDQPGARHLAILSDTLWQRRFGGDPRIIGAGIQLDTESYEVLGIMPPGFQFPSKETLVWIPLQSTLGAEQMRMRGNHILSVVAKLRPNVELDQSRVELDGIAKRIKQQTPIELTGTGANVAFLQERMVFRARATLLMLFGAAGCVLLIACVNITNLLLARATVRRREVAIRLALGASRLRLLQQFFVDGTLLSTFGAVMGLGLAFWGTPLLASMSLDIPRIDAARINAPVLLFTLLIALFTSVVMAVFPAVSLSRSELAAAIQERGKGIAGMRRGALLRNTLVVAEVALSLVLLIGTGLLLKSFARLRSVNLGFDPENVLTLRLSLPTAQYRTPAQRAAFFENLLSQIRALPGISAAGMVSSLPATGHFQDSTFVIQGHQPLPPGQFLDALLRFADPDYFTTMRIPLKRGRFFDASDRLDTAKKVIISELFAQKFFPGEDPLGHALDRGSGPSEIIGIVGDVRTDPAVEPEPTMYFPLFSGEVFAGALTLKGERELQTLVVPVQKTVAHLNRDLPLVDTRTMDAVLAQGRKERELNLILLGIFAGVAMTLAAVGLYGVMTYFIRQRRTEIGIRMALGASRSNVIGMLILQGLRPTILGILVGLAASVEITHLLSSQLFDISFIDPQIYAIVAAVLALIATLASTASAMGAVKIDPTVALRTD